MKKILIGLFNLRTPFHNFINSSKTSFKFSYSAIIWYLVISRYPAMKIRLNH